MKCIDCSHCCLGWDIKGATILYCGITKKKVRMIEECHIKRKKVSLPKIDKKELSLVFKL